MFPSVLPLLERYGFHPRSIQGKMALLTLLVVLLPLLGTTLFGNWITSGILRERAWLTAAEDVEEHVQQIQALLATTRQDITYLARLDSLRHYLNAAQTQQETLAFWQNEVATDFLIFAQTHPMYYQIRYLDTTGQERIRINQPLNEAPYIVSEDRLQNKAHRYYFQEARRLKRGQIYISPLDLNREFGSLEYPLHPVLRYAMPLYLGDQWVGVLVVNLHAQPLLDILYESNQRRERGAELILVDQNGYYLAHPDPEKRWGGPNDLNTGAGLRQDFPNQASALLSGQEGRLEIQREVWVYRPIFPSPEENPAYFWVLIRREPAEHLYASITNFRLVAGSVLALAILLSVLMSAGIARNITRPVLALRQAVERFGQGDLDIQVPVQSQDEIAALTQAFNQMAEAIRRDVSLLHRLNNYAIQAAQQRQATRVFHLTAETAAALCPHGWAGVYTVDGQQLGRNLASAGPPPPIAPPSHLPLSKEPSGRLHHLSNAQGTWWIAALHPSPSHHFALVVWSPSEDIHPPPSNWLLALVHQAEATLRNLHLYAELDAHRRQLSELLDQIFVAQEEERKLIAYDLHDGLIQSLVGARLHLNSYLLLRESDPQAAQAAFENGLKELQNAILEGRRLIEGLRPTELDDLGLAAAVEHLATEMAAQQGWQLDLSLHIPERLPSTVELMAFRIVQEALNNIRKHAQARTVHLRLWADHGVLYGSVQDDGQGFRLHEEPTSHQGCGLGLQSMRERARLLGGGCHIQSQPTLGTEIRFWLPLDASQEVRS